MTNIATQTTEQHAETEQQTLEQFIARHGITATAEERDHNPNIDPSDWARGAQHWLVTLRMGRRRFGVPFSQGSAHTEDPTAADVLNCLALDSNGIDEPFESWASDIGYEPDSRKAEKIYKVCQRQAKQLRKFLGSDAAYQSLLYDTELI